MNGDKEIDVRKNYKVKLPDAIVAATALVNNFKLVTRNIRDFKNIPGLKLLNLFEKIITIKRFYSPRCVVGCFTR